MKIKNILIKNFKSIKELNIPLNEYGSGSQKSKTTFLVGINESGKSAILEAISLIKIGFEDKDYSEYCFLEAQEDNDYVDLYTELVIDNENFWQKQVEEQLAIKKDFTQKIKFLKIVKNTYLGEEEAEESFEININEDLPFFEYIIVTTQKNVNGKIQKTEKLENLKELNSVEEVITKTNASKFLKENQKLLTKNGLESRIASNLKSTLNHNIPNIQIWKASPEYLINNIIDLDKFKEDTALSIPLKNIFHIYGKKNDAEIKSTIERALSKQARSDELEDKMTDKVTKHINRIWKEHKIKIKISINSKNCQVQIEDKDKKFNYYTMAQRSDGFKQFVSLILSLSAQNDSNKLTNNIILIDEPEVHLHPSGVKYMRDEILKIGKKNNVIVSTHSQNMVDTSTPERHWIVQKQKSETSILQINTNTPIEDDKVLASAFGINLFKELLPKNIIIVEGGDDKNIISHALKLIKDKFFYSIKSAGGASKSPAFARLLSDENVPAYLLFDSDKDGRDNKKKILDNQKEFYSTNNVFTLKDLNNDIPKDSTIEDVLPLDFVKSFFDKEMETSFNLVSDRGILHQIKNQNQKLKSDKQKLDSLKIKLSKEFVETYNTKSKIKGMDRLIGMIEKLVDKIELEE
jgi:predicted ATP-dependent endonuclease of OLD family